MGTTAIGGTGSNMASLMATTVEGLAADLGGDVNAKVAAMTMLQARESRALVQDSRRAEEQMLTTYENQQVMKMREQASHIREAGWQEGVATMVSGGLTMFGGACKVAAASGALTSTDVKTGNVSGEAMDAVVAGAGDCLPGAGAIASGVGQMRSAVERARVKEAEADETVASNHAAASKRTLDTLKEAEADSRDAMRSAIDFLREINQSSAGADRAAVFQRM